MKPEYQQWIDEHYPTKEAAWRKCKKATALMVSAFPELLRHRGLVMIQGVIHQHWWCEDGDNSVVDPTVHQWDFPIMEYRVIDDMFGEPKCKCLDCGDPVFESRYSNHCDPCGDAGCRF